MMMTMMTGLHSLLQPGSRDERKWRENEKMKWKWRENEKMKGKCRENEEMGRKISYIYQKLPHVVAKC